MSTLYVSYLVEICMYLEFESEKVRDSTGIWGLIFWGRWHLQCVRWIGHSKTVFELVVIIQPGHSKTDFEFVIIQSGVDCGGLEWKRREGKVRRDYSTKLLIGFDVWSPVLDMWLLCKYMATWDWNYRKLNNRLAVELELITFYEVFNLSSVFISKNKQNNKNQRQQCQYKFVLHIFLF